ncbi:MAG: 30S ribosomal protein S2, partial [Nitrospirae bacterium]|nr:30S ribosomal protein S2 [Candidatus Troglogloeales bacterium]
LAGIRDMNKLPGAVFIVDTVKERICLAEALRLKIPLIAMVDTNCDPDGIDYPIPGNDDGMRSIRLITDSIVAAILEGMSLREKGAPATAATTTPTNQLPSPMPTLESVVTLEVPLPSDLPLPTVQEPI